MKNADVRLGNDSYRKLPSGRTVCEHIRRTLTRVENQPENTDVLFIDTSGDEFEDHPPFIRMVLLDKKNAGKTKEIAISIDMIDC